MEELSAGKLVETRSRFYAHLYHIDAAEDITEILRQHRTRYKKANHHCYAHRFIDNQISIERCSDDGEVGHSEAGHRPHDGAEVPHVHRVDQDHMVPVPS